jgi:pyruvate-formate lyase-activating enzyme
MITNGIETKGYASKHLAMQALCRLFDKGLIDFKTWLSEPIINRDDRFYIEIANNESE